jgi:4-hydroxybenzoate polyprenyltransferase
MEEQNMIENKTRRSREELSKREKWTQIAVMLIPLLLILGLFGRTAVYQAFGASFATMLLTFYWFKHKKIYLFGAFIAVLVTILQYIFH